MEKHSPAQQCSDKSGTPAARCHSVCKNKNPSIVETSQNVLTLSKVNEINTLIAESEMLLGFISFSGICNFSFLSFTDIHQCWDLVYDGVKADQSSSFSPCDSCSMSAELIGHFLTLQVNSNRDFFLN